MTDDLVMLKTLIFALESLRDGAYSPDIEQALTFARDRVQALESVAS